MRNKLLSIVGIGEDGWDGLGLDARQTIEAAEVLIGGARHLSLVPPTSAERIPWPSPMLPLVDHIASHYRDRKVVVLASGDPMLHGVGSVFARRLSSALPTPHSLDFHVIPQVSAFSLACARLGWPCAEVTLLSAVNRPLEEMHVHVHAAQRLIIYSQDGATPRAIAKLLVERGYGPSAMTIFEHLGGPREARRDGIAASWNSEYAADLNLVAVMCIAESGTRALGCVPGLPDEAFESDGQLTKRDVRAATLARLAPAPGELLWDVGAGSGSVGIEWMRTDPSCRAISFEHDAERVRRIRRNAQRLGVPGLRVVAGSAPSAFTGVDRPDAVFIGGGIASEGLVQACWEALSSGGRLVANAVTIEGEVILVNQHEVLGGELVRIAVSRAEPIGSMLAWRPMMPITQWAICKP
ncbi:MAG TPA: precorrin-6y C5,15-methyltransferase (decarboxylating) subunit CbiE [Candidatus Baltobacteraceae bacterium]|jgi:precorrin-6Y C5,15-methyltransferase (decarboxylating)|nr:precorrin-6y C5,15-methyltransferase (decarboxylating) subunit CbiE [Candidatus Baltobacteraceae bacterium]